MAVSCVVTISPGFKKLLEKTHFSRGTLKSIIHEYQNTPSLWELGSQGEPSEKYVLNYFNRRTVGTPEQIAVWKGRYRAPHVYETYQDAVAARNVASQWFEDEDIMVYENDKHKWVLMIARPLDVFTIRKNSDAWLQDLQKDVDTTVNSGAVGRYIPDKRNKGKTAVAMDFLGKRLDNFYRQRGLKVRSKWSERNKKWLVEYAPEERGYVDDLTGGITDWTEGQKNAIDTLVNFLQNPGGGRYMLLEGAAGTGKTTLINEVLQRLEVTGKPSVLVGALSHKAKGVLGSKISKANRKKYTINAKSLAGMLGMKMTMKNINGSWQEVFEVDKHARRMGIPIQAASIVFIDEASMVSEEAMSYIEDLASAGTKIVFLGDQRQLPPIRTGGTEFWNQHPEFLVNPEADSPVFTRTDIPRVSLTERVRQGEDSPIHLVTDQFGNYTLQGGEFPNLSNVESSKDLRLVIENPATNLAEQMLPLFQEGMKIQNPNFAKIVAFTNAKVNQYNRELHFLLHPEMAASQDMNFAEGDLITMYDSFTYGNDTEPTVYNAEEGIVVSSSNTRHMSTTTGADIRYRDYTIKMQDDRTVTIPVLEQDATNIQNFNSALEQLKKEAINVGGRAWIPYFNLKGSMANMKMGYASTIHKSQGSTYQVVGVDTTDNFGSARFKSQGIYTALTRAANISILKGMGSTNAAPTAESISKANAREIARRQGMQIAGTPLSAEQVAFIKSEVDGVAKIIKDASVTITAMNLSKASPVTVKGVNDFKDGDTSTASAVCKSIINSPNATAQQKAYAKALLPLLAKMDFDILFATEENPIIQERLRKTRMEHWNAAGSTFNSKEAGLGYDIHIKVGVRKNQVIPEKVLLHEITHALTSNRLRNDAEFRRGIDQLSQYVQEWVRQNKDESQMVMQNYGGADIPFDIYGFRNYQDSGYADFVAEAMSNASFQELLKQIPAPRESELNTWQKLCKLVSDAFKKLFNISYKQNTTVYDMLIPVIADTMSLTSEQEQRDSPYTEWNIERTTQMMANATELVKAMNVAVEDKDVHWTTEQVMQLFGEPLPQETPSIANLNFYSGGAEGADTEWGNAIQAIGGTVTHYTIDFYDGLSKDEKDRLEKRYQEVRQALGYHEANDPKTKKLLRRDMLQADNAKEVFAIGTINQETQRVNGGTLYAVTRAQLSGKPIHVFNQADNKWYFYDYQAGAWWQEDTPTITQDAALIGTRGINAAGKQAIKDVLAKSTGQQPTTQQGPIQSPSTGGNEGLPNLSNLKGKTVQYGVEIDPNLIQNYREWLNTHPNGIVAYRVNKATFNTPQAVEQGIIGNPFDWQKYGAGKAVEMFYDWLVNNNNYDEPLATDEFRRAIIERIHSAPEDTPVLYYKELGYPSHATVIGWAISEFNRIKKEKAARDQARGYTDEQAKRAIELLNNNISHTEGVIAWLNNKIKYNQATSETYTELEERRRQLSAAQSLLDGLNTGKSQIIINQYGVPQVVERAQAEKPAEKNIVINDTYELSPVETEKEGYSQGYIIKKKNAEGTPKQGAAQIQRMIDHDELPLGAHIMWQGLTAEELSELNKVKGLNKNTDGSWTVGYTEREVILRKQNDTLLNSPLFGSHELHKLAALTMFKLSEVITQLQEGTVNIEDILMEESLDDDLRNTEFKGMDRIDIINAIGLDKLFKDVIREEVFNADINERLQEDFDLAEKAQVIYDNFDAFIRLGYQALIDLENISIDTEKAVDTGTDQKKGENGEDLTDEEVVALFGSTVEHWQVGFRQVSTFASLSNLIRKHLNRLYVLDKNGEKVLDEYGIERNIDSHEAVSKILKWTQGARNLEDMIIKLEGKIAQEPWVKQLTDVLRGDGNEQFKSQFYSNFKKYFQKYNIIYKEKQKDGSTVTKVKTINRDPFVINTMDMITSLDNSKHIGSFNLWNPRTNSIDTNALANVKQGAEALTKLIEVRKSGNPITTQSNGSEIAEVEAALNALNIPMPSKELLIKTLDSVNVLQTLQGALSGLFETFMRAPSGKADYKFINNKTQSNYRRIVEAFAPVMGDGLDSVSYEAGKLHYSYVTPSYLSKFVENMKGMRGDVRAFIESEYGNIEGWFRNKANNANQAGGEGWLNYILDRMMDTTEEARKTRAKFDHVVVLSDDSIAYAEKSPVQYAASMLSMYFYDDHRQSAYFRIPMMSNKQSEEYIKFDRIADNFKEVITDWLLDKTYAQELNRIRAVNFRNNAPAELERLRQKDNLTAEEQQRLNILEEYLKDGNPAKISSFDENGATFMFMEYLNDYVNDKNSELGKLLRKQINGEKFDETQNESTRFRELLREAIVSNLDARFDEFLRNLSREGFLQLSPSMEVIKVNALKDKLPQGKAKGLLEEFFWNDMFMSINMMQLLCTDIAYYKNTEDLQKRFAQWHSPGLRGNTEATINGEKVTDGNARSMIIADKIEKSDVVETLGRVKKKVLSQARFADNPAARDLMEAQIDKIIDAFKEVNVTDAQAYTSPTGYRKKMAIFGQWSERDEEVYQKILNGTFTAEDLDVLWQPLKPFVYSQITKNGYNPYIPLLKMGIQQKNSEYCLILADALMRSAGEESTLTALFDFMEESHGLTRSGNHWTGTPHDHGIDTIMFNSAVKTGLMGVLDINSMSHDDIVKGLKKFAGVGQNEYDDRYVDTIPFEDYSIQQYNPAHLEGEQQLGSQNRVLVFADMPNEIDGVEQFIEINGEKVSVKQAKINYFKAIAENIAISEAGVRERFALDSPSRKIRNVALMRVLQEEIAKDARYGTDLQWACLLDESGNFNVPLSDAIQSDRIQQLLNSIIKNRINKQEISGGPVVQVSNYGTSKNLRIVRNADGTIKYYECYITAYDQQLYEDFGDGKGGIDMEKIQKTNPKLLEMIGYRIPTEAKYSMAPLKIVGFLPRTAGEGIMLPKEITTLSGSDFDVDKMYIMRYRLNRTDNSAEFIKKEMEDYYLGNKMSGARVSREDSAAYRARLTGLVRGTIKPTTDTDHRIMSYWRQQREVKYEDFAEGRYHNDNLIIATQWGILTSGMAEDQVLASGNFDDVKQVGYMLAAMDNGVQYDTASTMSGKALKKAAYTNKYLQYADTQIQFHKQNMVAAKLIGVFAQANVSHAIVGMSDVEAKIQIPEGGGFSINGVNYKEGATFKVDEEYGLDNATRISTVLAQLLASSVDAVKDPVLNLLNINMDTVNIAVTLVRLGHDLEFIGLFLTHPIIKQLINRYNVEKASGSSNSLMQTLITMQNELMGEDRKGAALQLKYNYNKDFFVREHQLSNRQDAEYLQYRRNMDLTVLEIFKKLNNMAEMFRGVVHTTRYNSITSAVGPYASDTMNNRLKDEQFASNSYVTDDLKKAAEGIIYDENGNEVSIIQAFRDTSSELERELLGKNIIQANDEAYKVYSALKSRMGYMSNKMAREFGRFYMSYYMNMESPLFDLSYENRKEMLDEFPNKFMAAKNQYRDNAFVQAVMMDQDKAGNSILALNTRGLTDTELQSLRSAWSDLYTSEREKGIEDKDNLALKLVEYNFFLGSFGFSPKTFMSLTPNTVKLAIPGYKESLLKELVMTPDRIDNLLMQFMLNLGYANLGTVKEEDLNWGSDDLLPIETFGDVNVSGLAKVQMKDGSTKWLYVEPIGNSSLAHAYFVDKLGGENQQCFEIDPSKKVYEMKSVVENAEPQSAPAPDPDSGESVAPLVEDNRPIYQRLMVLLTTYSMDDPKLNMRNLQDRFNKLYNAGQERYLSETTGIDLPTLAKIAEVLGVTPEELTKDVNDSENKLNLCK